ncbi:hypothetical protein [Flavobacterium sp.]|uniref:hypothetical protein n=1 Tax=Flavobacterium sp. TaxID=239 RepID=UPI0040481A3D
MIEQKLEEKLRNFLKDNNREYYKDSIRYKGLRESGYIDGTIRNFHMVSYMVSVSDLQYDSDWIFYVSFDEKNHNLVEIIGPQSYENFEK